MPAKKTTKQPPIRLPAIPEDKLSAEQKALMSAIAS